MLGPLATPSVSQASQHPKYYFNDQECHIFLVSDRLLPMQVELE